MSTFTSSLGSPEMAVSFMRRDVERVRKSKKKKETKLLFSLFRLQMKAKKKP